MKKKEKYVVVRYWRGCHNITLCSPTTLAEAEKVLDSTKGRESRTVEYKIVKV